MPESVHKPEIQRLQGKILVPCNARQVQRTAADGQAETVWAYTVIEADPGAPIGDLEHWKQESARRLNLELQAFICSIYDIGTQVTLNGYAARALFEDRPDIVAECRKVQDWVDQVLEYYDQRKQALLTVATEDARMEVVWDFAADVPPTDYVDWRNVKTMFGAQG